MSKRSFRIALAVVLGSLVLVGALAGYVVHRALGYPDERRHGQGTKVEVAIDQGMSFPQIAAKLHEQHVIDKPMWFRLYAMHRGVTTDVKTGHYVLRDDMTPKEVLDSILVGVKDVTVAVKIPEGLNMLEVFDIVEKAGVCKRADLEKLARDPAYLKKMAIDGDSVEGYLFPETYQLKQPSRPDEVLGKLIAQHRVVWDRVERTHQKQIKKLRDQLHWSDRDMLVMASIVEKEAVIDQERPRIAQVFINRLTTDSFKPHKLETDPTIRYGCEVPLVKSAACQKWDRGRLHRIQLDDVDNPYNTYQHEGLPPGPICNPGERSLIAAIAPDGSDYFYFVAKDDHSHVFAKTLAEHQKNVDKYMR